jgi:hypothetical protein
LRVTWWGNLISGGSWFLLPVLGLIGSALPALDAHTRMLFGRPLHYQVTAKFPAAWTPEPASSEPLSARAG